MYEIIKTDFKPNARREELLKQLQEIDIVTGKSYLEDLALGYRFGGQAYHGKIIKKGLDALPAYLSHLFRLQVDELKKLLQDG